ncbi:MAG: hypothetical protein D8B43_02770, partial [Lachnoanaerobaculum sp.]
AYLYANILSFYPKNSEIYLAYIDEMTSYALEEAKQAHIDSSLAVIYQEVLSVDIVDEQLQGFCHPFFVPIAFKRQIL